jgi:hypothetical protein
MRVQRVWVSLVLLTSVACTGRSTVRSENCAYQDHSGGVNRTLQLTRSGSTTLDVKVGTGIELDFAGAKGVRSVSVTPGSAELAPGTQNGLRGDSYVFTVIGPGKVEVSAITTSGARSATVVATC